MNQTKYFIIHKKEDFKKPIKEIILEIKKYIKERSLIVFLNGEFGSGKTTFIKIFAHIVGVNRNVQSPTFVLMKNYFPENSIINGLSEIVHVDAYRLEPHHKELLAIDELVKEPGKVLFIEGPTGIGLNNDLAFANIIIDVIDQHTRKISLVINQPDQKEDF